MEIAFGNCQGQHIGEFYIHRSVTSCVLKLGSYERVGRAGGDIRLLPLTQAIHNLVLVCSITRAPGLNNRLLSSLLQCVLDERKNLAC